MICFYNTRKQIQLLGKAGYQRARTSPSLEKDRQENIDQALSPNIMVLNGFWLYLNPVPF